MKIALLKLLLGFITAILLSVVIIRMQGRYGIPEIQTQENIDMITGDIATNIKGLEETRNRMGQEMQIINKLESIKQELELEIIDRQENYGLLHEAATIYKEEIKVNVGLN